MRRPELSNPPWLIRPHQVSLAKRHPAYESGRSGGACHAQSWGKASLARFAFGCCKISRGLWKPLEQRIHITNILETWRSTRTVEAAMQRKKLALKCTIRSLCAAGFTNRKFEVANDLLKGRWSTCTSYERSCFFSKDSQKVMISRGLDKGRSGMLCSADSDRRSLPRECILRCSKVSTTLLRIRSNSSSMIGQSVWWTSF